MNTANDIVPIMNPSELLNFSINGGFDPCCVNDDSHFGRAIMYVRMQIWGILYKTMRMKRDDTFARRLRYEEMHAARRSITWKESHAKRRPDRISRRVRGNRG